MICSTIRAVPIVKAIGNNSSTEKRDNSSINTQDVIGIFCARPKNTTAPTKADIPKDIGAIAIAHTVPNTIPKVLPNIIDGVIRPPYAPAAKASKTATHLDPNRPNAYVHVISFVKVNSLPALPFPRISGKYIAKTPISVNATIEIGIITGLLR